MAEPQQIPPTVKTKNLKYLGFVQVAAECVRVRLSTVYECVKDNSGPLKSAVQAVESQVRAVIRPVYDKFHDVPFELLNFVDHKVDEVITEVDRHVPLLVKQASSQARAVASKVQEAGVVDTAREIAKTMYTKYGEKVNKPLDKHYTDLRLFWNRLWGVLFNLVCLPFRLMGNLLGRFKDLFNLLRGFKFLFYLVGLPFRLMGNLLWGFKCLFNLWRRFKPWLKMGLRLAGWRINSPILRLLLSKITES